MLNTAAILCTGVFIAPPRTAATTYEMAIQPLTDKLDLLPFSILFFAVVFLLTIRPTRVVDLVGRCLTPVLILGILVLILAGILHPIGPLEPPSLPTSSKTAFWPGIRPWTSSRWPALPSSSKIPCPSPA